MPPLLVVILLSSIGWQATRLLISLTPTLWYIYISLLPHTPSSKSVNALRTKQSSILHLRKTLAETSSQDEFAKWARIRREHDKKIAELEKLNAEVAAYRHNFNSTISQARWIVFSLFSSYLHLWYRSEAVVWLPDGWVPGYVEWVLGLPSAPRGAVGVAVWSAACGFVCALLAQGVEKVYEKWVSGVGEEEAEKVKS